MGLTPTQFGAEMLLLSTKFPESHIVPIHKKIAGQALAGVVNKTPVDTGRARGGWQVGVGSSPSGDSSSSNPVSDGLQKMESLRPYGAIHIANNVEYIGELENGSSKKQAPAGMLSVTLEEIANQFR